MLGSGLGRYVDRPLITKRPMEGLPSATWRERRRGKKKAAKKLRMPQIGYGENLLASPRSRSPWPPPLPQSLMPPGAEDSLFGASASTNTSAIDFRPTTSPLESSVPFFTPLTSRSWMSQSANSATASQQFKPRPPPMKQLPASYTTVFERPQVVCRRLMTNADRLQYLVHGIQPLPPRPVSATSTAHATPSFGLSRGDALANAARDAVHRHIERREDIVAELHNLLPMPDTEERRAAASMELHLDATALQRVRATLALMLAELRAVSIAVCQGVARWREFMRRSSDEIAFMPLRELTFCYNGVSYLLKMTTDLAFLPLPLAFDPLLINWFREHLPWLLTSMPRLARKRHVPVALDLAPAFDLPPTLLVELADDAATADPMASPVAPHVQQASFMLIEEMVRCATPRAPALLARAAQARARSADPAVRWQWAAYQHVIYGGDSYASMLRSLPHCVQTLHLSGAALVVQRAYRQRLARKLLRTIRTKREEQRANEARRRLRAATRLQCIWRGFFLRTALTDVLNDQTDAAGAPEIAPDSPVKRNGSVRGSVSSKKRERTSDGAKRARASLQARKERKAERDQQIEASVVIQRRARVVNARKDMSLARTARDRHARAAKSLVEDAGPALDRLRTLAVRQRVLRLVLCGLYEDGLAASAMVHVSPVAPIAIVSSHRPQTITQLAPTAPPSARPSGGGTGSRSNSSSLDPSTRSTRKRASIMPTRVLGGVPSSSNLIRPLTCTTPLEEAAKAALGSSLPAAKKLTREVGKLEDEQRAIGRKIVAAAVKAAETAAASAAGGTTSRMGRRKSRDVTNEAQDIWSDVVLRASQQAAAAAAAAADAVEESSGGAGEAELAQLLAHALPKHIGTAAAPRAQVEIIHLLAAARDVAYRARIAAAQAEAETKVWTTVAATARTGTTAESVLEASRARDKAASKARAAVAAVRIAEEGFEGSVIDAREAGFAFGSDLGATVASEGAASDRVRLALGTRAAIVDVRGWRVLPSPALLSAGAMCEAVTSELKSISALQIDAEGKRAMVETAAMNLARSEGEAAVANATMRVRTELDQLEKKGSKEGLTGKEATAYKEGAASAEAAAKQSAQLVSAVDSFLTSSAKDVESWLMAEGKLRVMRPLLASVLKPLERLIAARRCEVYRGLYAADSAARCKARNARTITEYLEAAMAYAANLSRMEVFESSYSEATLTVCFRKHTEAEAGDVLRASREGLRPSSPVGKPPLAVLVKTLGKASAEGDDAREKLVQALIIHCSVNDEDRLRVVEYTAMEEDPGDWRKSLKPGELHPPATRIVFGVRRAAAGEEAANEVLVRLYEQHTTGKLTEILFGKSVGKDAIASCEISTARETIHERLSLPMMAEEAFEATQQSRRDMEELAAEKPQRQVHVRAWERVLGSMQALSAMAAGDDGDDDFSLTSGGGGVVPPTLCHLSTVQRQVRGWAGLHDARILDIEGARDEHERRSELRHQSAAAHGQLICLAALKERCVDWPNVCVPGRTALIDARWNTGPAVRVSRFCDAHLKSSLFSGRPDSEMPKQRRSTREAAFDADSTRFCHFCASLPKPVRAPHRMVDCPKRVKANEKEFTPEVLDTVVAQLKLERSKHATIARECLEAAPSDISRADLKKELLRCAGVGNLMGALCGPPPAPPPPPPRNGRRDELQTLEHVRSKLSYQLVKRCAAASAEGMSGWWAEIRAVAMMAPQPRDGASATTPNRVIGVGSTVGVALAARGGSAADYMILPLVLELTRAPLPQFWALARVDGAGGTGGELSADAPPADSPEPPKFVHVNTGETRDGHPLAMQLAAWVRHKKDICKHPKPSDSWVVFAHPPPAQRFGRGEPPSPRKGSRASDDTTELSATCGLYCYDFATGKAANEWLPKECADAMLPSVLPPPMLEPSAMRIAESAAACWPGMSGTELLLAAKRDLWDKSAAGARVAQLAAQPCPLNLVLTMAKYLGIEPCTHPHLLWLAHAALAPEPLPMGWAASADEMGEAYYWHRAHGIVQWEHPTVAFLCGVAARLIHGSVASSPLTSGPLVQRRESDAGSFNQSFKRPQ